MLYNLILILWAFFQVPLRLLKGRGADLALRERLGWVDFPRGPVYLFHGVSVGEIKVLGPIYKAFKDKLPCVVTTSTRAGLEEARRSLPGAYVFLMPFDLSFVMRRFMRRLKPRALILSEGDLWPNHLKYAKKEGAFIVCINAKLSDRSAKRSKLVAKWLIEPLDLVCAQSEAYAQHFRSLGAKEVVVTGNLKFDHPFVKIPSALKKRLGLSGKEVLTIGSTHTGEELALLKALTPLLRKNPKLHILLAPRHKERAESLYEQLQKMEFSSERLSQYKGKALPRILLIDELGLLKDLYRLSDVSIVAGSFSGKVGGHNLFEPLQAKSVLIYGPHVYSQKQMHQLVQGAQAGLQLNVEEIAPAVERLFADKKEREALVHRGESLVKSAQGSLKKTLQRLKLELKRPLA